MKALSSSLVVALLAALLLGASQSVVVTGQLLAYQDGYVFFTTGDGFRVAHGLIIKDAQTGHPTSLAPAPRIWARATFDSNGIVTELDLSRSQLPQEGSFDNVSRFAVAASTPVPNPDLLAYAPTPSASSAPELAAAHYSGRPVLVRFIVQVPPNTPFTSSVYITTDAAGWNPQAIPMNRIDGLHYEITRRYASGTIFRYLYDRGSFQSVEVAQNGLQRAPRSFVVADADVFTLRDTVYEWQDSVPGGASQPQPQIMPTPYNPAPFPNLPPSIGLPHGPSSTPHPPDR